MYEGPLQGNGYGVKVHDGQIWRNPRSKKEVREVLTDNPAAVRFLSNSLHHEAHSLYGHELVERAISTSRPFDLSFVGPDPERNRKFFGTVKVTVGGTKVA
jgi:uncharacterized protein (DUF2461 family)